MEASPPALPPDLPDETRAAAAANPSSAKTVLNAAAAAGFAILAIWTAVADFSYPGDLLFQTSVSLPLLAIYLSTLFVVAVVFAIFPKRIVIGANVLLLSRCALGFPLNIWMGNSPASRIVAVALVVLALYYLAGSVRRLLQIEERPWVHGPHSIAVVVALVLFGMLSIPFSVLGIVKASENLLGDYLRVSTRSLSLVERVFERGDQRVHLIGMMHIGDSSFYENLNARMSVPVDGKRLVLTEGVSDDEGILPKSFASGETYARWARSLGLKPQEAVAGPENAKGTWLDHAEAWAERGVTFRNADIDISELGDPYRTTLISLLDMLSEPNPVKLLLSQPEDITGRDIELLLVDGLLKTRNDVLMEHFEDEGSEFAEIYIPWGAAHLTDIEARLRELGYEEADEFVRPIVTFWK